MESFIPSCSSTPLAFRNEPIPTPSPEFVEELQEFKKQFKPYNTNPEYKEWIDKHNIYLQFIAVAILNIAGSISNADYVEKFIAQMVQEPDKLLPRACIFSSKCQQGKDLLANFLAVMLGQDYYNNCCVKQGLIGEFACPFCWRLLCTIQEPNKHRYGRNIRQFLKSAVDPNEYLWYREKGSSSAHRLRNFCRVFIFTTHLSDIPINPELDTEFIFFRSLDEFPEMPYIHPDTGACYLSSANDVLRHLFDAFKHCGWFISLCLEYFKSLKYTTQEIIEYRPSENERILKVNVDPIEQYLLSDHFKQLVKKGDWIPASTLLKDFNSYMLVSNTLSRWNSTQFGRRIAPYVGKYVLKRKSNGVKYQRIEPCENDC